MLDQIPVCQKVWKHYAAILQKGQLSGEQLRAMAIRYLMQGAPLEYLDGELLESLLLSLYRYGMKVCGRCLQLFPHSQFSGLLARICTACQRRDRAEYQNRWRAQNKAHRARYMRNYRAQKRPSGGLGPKK